MELEITPSDTEKKSVLLGYTIQGSFDLGALDASVRETTPLAEATSPAGYRVRAFEFNANDAPKGFMRMSLKPVAD
jgi:hypothetical protein